MAKKRNHYIPRYLLKHFASRREGKKAWVWVYRKADAPREVSVGDVGVASHFYGRPETGVEDGLVEIENQHSAIVTQLLAGEDPNAMGRPLCEAIWLMAVRTQNLRGTWDDMVTKGLDAMVESAGTESAARALKRQLDSSFDEELDTLLNQLGPMGDGIREQLVANPQLRDVILSTVAAELESLNLSEAFGSILNEAFEHKPKAKSMQDGHVRAMKKLLESNPVPDRLRSTRWQVFQYPGGGLVLGDGLVIAQDASGEVGHPIRFSNEWVRLMIPIASDTLLIATHEGANGAQPAAHEVNAHSVALSHSSFFADRSDERLAVLLQSLGTGVAGLPDDEIRQIVDDSWGKV